MPPRTRPSLAKHWVFTWNNPTVSAAELVLTFPTWGLTYAVFQDELGEEGTPHFQGYAEFDRRARMTSLKKLSHGATMHWEPRYGTRDQARQYAMKDDTRVEGPWEFGEWQLNAQGKRSDLLDAIELLSESASLVAVAEDYPSTYIRYHRGFQALLNVTPRTRSDAPTITLLCGPPNCGKTRHVRDLEPFEQLWASPPGDTMRWFDHYQNQEAALFDDFDGKLSKVPLTAVLQILDRYAIRVATKGSHTWWTPLRVYITSNFHPRQWYDWYERELQYGALRRRFTHVIHWDFDAATGPVDPTAILTPTHPGWLPFWDQLV